MMMMSGSGHHETAAGGSTSSEGERSFYHLDLTDSEDDYQPPSSSSDSESHESESETFCSPSSISRRPKKRKSTPVKSVRVTQASSSSTPVNRPLQEQSRPTQRHSRILPMMTVDQLATETPRRSRSPMDQQNIIQVLHRIEQKIDDMGKDIKKLKEDQAELEKQITTTKSRGSNADNKIYVPPKIRTAVHDGYKAVISDGAKEWITSEENRKFKFLSEENVETSKLVETYVKGLYPDVQPGVIQAATARYFESVQQKQHKEKTGKKEAHNNKMLLYSRKKRKLSWRSSMIMRKTGWDEEKKKENRQCHGYCVYVLRGRG